MANESIPAAIPLSSEGSTGVVYEHGGHLSSWVPVGSEAVLWMSSLARFEPGIAIRGGVPIIFPWFGAGRPGNLTPAHGFARTRSWRLVDQGQDDNRAFASFELTGSANTDSNFPFAFAAHYEVRLGRTLDLSLIIENLDDEPFSFESALHTYFHVSDIRQVRVEGLDGRSYLDQADTSGLVTKQQRGDVTFTGETDRIYNSKGQIRVIDEGLRRVLVIDKENSDSTVVWNPWAQKAQRMNDFGDDEWLSMLCIEGGNLRESAVQLEPGQAHRMSYSVRVEAFSQHQTVRHT